jgi:hypothetical protein
MSPFNINYQRAKYPNLEELGVTDVQAYNPLYDRFFKLDESTYNLLALNHAIQVADIAKDCFAPPLESQVFVKFSPLLDPLNFLRGKYDLESTKVRALPQWGDTSANVVTKMLDPNNSSYVDAFFCFLTSKLKDTHGFVHGLDFYGSFLAKQKRFKYNIVDDLEYLMKCSDFSKNLNKHYSVDKEVFDIINEYDGVSSRRNKNKLNIGEDVEPQDIFGLDEENLNDIVLDAENLDEMVLEYENVIEANNCGSDSDSDSDSDSNSDGDSDTDADSDADSKPNLELNINNLDSNECESKECESSSDSESIESDSSSDSDTTVSMESEWETESESESEQESIEYEEDENMFSYLYDFPVQLIFQERCAGTLDELVMTRKLKGQQLINAFAQIALILATYQRIFEFTHNDLHTNNIMWVPTDKEFLFYKLDNNIYKVPTHGRIFKLIDFGRAIYKYNGKLFCSDSFSSSGDAATQYNCEPYFNAAKPRIDPNPSFDLCRLGCSLLDFVKEPDVQAIVSDWCNDDAGKSVLYKSNGQERYPDFKLYKMIARTVHHLVPEKQEFLNAYIVEQGFEESEIMDISGFH